MGIGVPVVFLWISISISINRVEKLNDIRHTTISLILVVGISHAFSCFCFLFVFDFLHAKNTCVSVCMRFFPCRAQPMPWVRVKEERSWKWKWMNRKQPSKPYTTHTHTLHHPRVLSINRVFVFMFNRENNNEKTQTKICNHSKALLEQISAR